MIDPKLIARINELSKKKKDNTITDEEFSELLNLRQEYLKLFKEGFKQTISNVKVIDSDGNDVTPKKGRA